MESKLNLRLSSLLLLFWSAIQFVSAYDFESGGVYYNITSKTDMTAAVTYFNKTGNTYSGVVSIPASVVYDGNTYTVTAIGEEAFSECPNLTATVGRDSYAAQYCKENGIRFIYPDSLDWLNP